MWVDEMKSYEAKIQNNTPVPTSLFWFSISKDEYDSLICILALCVIRLPCWLWKQPMNRVIRSLYEQLRIKNTNHKAFPHNVYVEIVTSYRITKTGQIYDNKLVLRNATIMHIASSKCYFEKNNFVGTKMCASSQTSTIVLGVRAKNKSWTLRWPNYWQPLVQL